MDYAKPTERPAIGKFLKFDHIKFHVGNAKQAASFYTSRFGFEYCAYKGLENNERETATHVVKPPNSSFYFAFVSPYGQDHVINEHVRKHGDGVADIAFTVEDCKKTYEYCMSKGAISVSPVTEYKDEHGSVLMATIKTFDDTVHSFVQRVDYNGPFLPGFMKHLTKEAFNEVYPCTDFEKIDHVVNNQRMGDMEPTCEWYEKVMAFHRFWSVDDKILHTDLSALNSVVMTDFDENVKMPCNEPAIGKSQIQEYVDYYNGSGVQHIAIKTQDIIQAVTMLRKRGLEFLKIPKAYYDNLRSNLPNMKVKITEDIDVLEELQILVDYDDEQFFDLGDIYFNFSLNPQRIDPLYLLKSFKERIIKDLALETLRAYSKPSRTNKLAVTIFDYLYLTFLNHKINFQSVQIHLLFNYLIQLFYY